MSVFDQVEAGLNAAVMSAFGRAVVMVTPAGTRFDVDGDWRQEPVLIEGGDSRGVVSTFQPMLGIDLATWPAGRPRIDEDWSGWKVEIPVASAAPGIAAGRWDVANVVRPGGAWIDLELTNHAPLA
ncbi:MAG: hypothetical protein IH626_05395 [Rhodospirillales bacterium]|nr:hypothetical protein [Rhodospirillales bacterium]